MSCYGINKENKCYAEVYTMEESKMMAYKPNLLLNGDFKVNQKGQLVYENSAYTAQDSIDKWKIMAGKVNTSFVNYLTIESYNETGSSYFLQNFDSEKSGDFVISIKVLNINKGSFRVYFEGTNQQDSYTIASKGIYKITFRDVKDATGVCLALDNFSGDIEYIRLDEGTVPLPHMKEDYEIALARCGKISELNGNLGNINNKTSVMASVYLETYSIYDIVEFIKSVWDTLPTATQILGQVQCGGWYSMWGTIYPGYQYGSVILHSYNGNAILLYRYNGAFHTKDLLA